MGRRHHQVLGPRAILTTLRVAPGDVPTLGVLADQRGHRPELQRLRRPQGGRHRVRQRLHAVPKAHDPPGFPPRAP
jgi:hypothetical protein